MDKPNQSKEVRQFGEGKRNARGCIPLSSIVFALAVVLLTTPLIGAIGQTTSGPWFHTQEISRGEHPIPEDTVRNDRFGETLALDKDWAVVGAPGASSVHLFRATPTGWTLDSTLHSEIGGFGSDVAIDGDTIAVGADQSNQVLLYHLQAEGWVPDGALAGGSDFGDEVAIEGDTLVVGVPGGNHVAVLVRSEDAWTWTQNLTTWGTGCLGSDVDIDGAVIVAAAVCTSDTAHVFEKHAGTREWSHEARLTAADGHSVAADADAGLVGVGDFRAGHVAVYEQGPEGWILDVLLTPQDEWPDDPLFEAFFGRALDVQGTTVFVGAPTDDRTPGLTDAPSEHEIPCGTMKPPLVGALPPCPGPGAVYVYQRIETMGWAQVQKLQPPHKDSLPWQGGFGSKIAVEQGELVVGDPHLDLGWPGNVVRILGGVNAEQGSAYFFTNPTHLSPGSEGGGTR